MLLGTTFIDRCFKSIFPAERKIVCHHSPALPIFMIQENDGYNNNTSTQVEVISLLQTSLEVGFVNIKVAQCSRLKAGYESPIVFTFKEASIPDVHPYGNVSKIHASMVAGGIMNIYPDRRFHVKSTIF